MKESGMRNVRGNWQIPVWLCMHDNGIITCNKKKHAAVMLRQPFLASPGSGEAPAP